MEPRTLANRYRLEEAIGRGGMGVVHRARDLELDRAVAVKLLAEGDASARERFVVEAKRTAGVRHPAIIEVFDVGHEGEESFLVMELLEGETLEQRIEREGRLDVAVAVEMAQQICDALGAAHDAGLAHRDLKPANVFVLPDGRIKLLDFGIAKRIDGATARTAPEMLVGTIEFMAPEQIKGGSIDGRVDLYALGLTLFVALSGEHPFASADNIATMLHSHLSVAPPLLRERVPAAPAALEVVVARLLEKEPRRRFADAREVRRALADALLAPSGAEASRTGASRAEAMRTLELEDVPAGIPSLELAAERPLATSVVPVAPMVALAPPAPLVPAPGPPPLTIHGVPGWLAPLARVPEELSKRVLAYSLIALALDVVFFGAHTAPVVFLALLASGGGLAMWVGHRARN